MNIKKSYEYIIIGSGFGGAFAAATLARAGREVLIVERGAWAIRDDSCWDEIRLHLRNPLYRGKTDLLVDQKKTIERLHTDDTVGGMSTLYGAVSLRMREHDFMGAPLPDSAERDASFAWPYTYRVLAPFYDRAEILLGIAGRRGQDITEPPIKKEYLHAPGEILSAPSQKISNAAQKLGLHPFQLPMAINFSGKYGKNKCISCSTCDHYICKIEAKNDLAVTLLPRAIKDGAVLVANTRAVHITMNHGRAQSVDIIDQTSGERKTIRAKTVICAGGALATPHLLLSSGIQSPGGDFIGRNLMRHANGVVAGVFPTRANPEQTLQKQIGIPDYYFGDPDHKALPAGPWGMIQDVSSIGKGVIRSNAPWGLKTVAAAVSDYLINLMCMAEDLPQYANRVYPHPHKKDRFGMPELCIYHRYHRRDIHARNALYGVARRILRRAGALFFYSMPFETFSHALGTCRMGTDPSHSALDPECRVWGTKNLYVFDAGMLPTGGSVNPSLTVAAASLRAASMLVQSKH